MIIKGILKLAKTLLIVAIILMAILLSIQFKPFCGILFRGDCRSLAVLSGSMEPFLGVGDLVIVKSIDAKNVNVGEVITFKAPRGLEAFNNMPGCLVTHRVVRVIENNNAILFKTKGDANEDSDGWLIDSNDLVGKVEYVVPYVGNIMQTVKSPAGYIFLIIVPAVLIIAGEIKTIIECISEGNESSQEL